MGLSDYVYRRTRSRLAGLTDEEYFWEPVPGCCTVRRTGSGACGAYRADCADRAVAVLRPATGPTAGAGADTGVGKSGGGGAGGGQGTQSAAWDPPFTTIAWRLWHLTGTYGGERNPRWLGVERAPGGFEQGDPAPGSAAQALAALDRAAAFWQGVLQELPTASWWEPLGPVAGPFAEDDKASLVLHQLDEQIHHGAELGVLRDLYRHQRAGSGESAESVGSAG